MTPVECLTNRRLRVQLELLLRNPDTADVVVPGNGVNVEEPQQAKGVHVVEYHWGWCVAKQGSDTLKAMAARQAQTPPPRVRRLSLDLAMPAAPRNVRRCTVI
eukprot:TRINITY_DN1956_c0_g1_i7.p1 TRINITY_DN1956_c0_g1~~TRINITY_DN1956_c0_g1_i7.p1  ORF type:complete len:103 (+),score=18.66 TRINITY_DN1956_c0_g1_i7:250-558(+)